MKRGAVALLVVAMAGSLFGQTVNPVAPGTSVTPAVHPAEPYKDDEFPPWVLKLRRFEIITVGAFPLAYLFAGVGYDYYYYASNGFPSENTPWPAGPGTSRWTTASQPDQLQQKNITLVEVSLALSLALATADWLLGLDE